MNKQEFETRIKRQSQQELQQESIDIYWLAYFNLAPIREKAEALKGDDYQHASHLFEWNMIARITEPNYVNGLFKGATHYFYRIN